MRVQPAEASEYSLVGGDATMDLLAGNNDVSELLVETKVGDGQWVRDALSSSSAAAAGDAGVEEETEPAMDDATWRAWLAVLLSFAVLSLCFSISLSVFCRLWEESALAPRT
jgi:hypothetical protein